MSCNSRIGICFLLVVLFLSGTDLLAKEKEDDSKYKWSGERSEGYSYKYVTNDPTKTRFYKLKNGLTVILSPNTKEPRMQVFIAVKAGSKTDPATHTGLAHYLEHMMFKGTAAYGSLNWQKEQPLLLKIDTLYEAYNKTTDEVARKRIYEAIDSVSGAAAKFAIANEYDKMMSAIGVKGTNAFTSFEQTVYTEDVPANAVDKFFKVQAERFRNPVFRIFHTELEAVYEEKNRSLDNDNNKVSEMMLANLFLNHNYGKQTTIGTIEHLKNPSLLEIRKYYNKYYVPNNMGIIICGDFEPDAMIKKVDDYFSFMSEEQVEEYKFAPEAPITTPVEKVVLGPDAEFTTIGYRMPGVHDKDALLAELVSQVLTNGKAGLIDLNLVKKQKLVRAFAGVDILKDYGYMYLRGNPTTGQSLEEVKALMLGEIEQLKKGNFDEALLVSIINNAKKALMQQNEKYNYRAYALMGVFTIDDDWKNNVTYAERLSKLTKKDIVDFANKYFGQNYVVIYKRQGEDKSIVKVEKPPITAVETNRDAQSQFVKKVINMRSQPIKPVWLDYNKDIMRSYVGPAQLLYVQNTDNDLFRMSYRYKTGIWNNKKIAIAAQYLQFLGTDKMSAEDLSKQFYKLACSFSIKAENEYTTVSLEGLQENFEKAATLLEALLANCKPDEQALAALKVNIGKSRADAKKNKYLIRQGLASYARYGASNPFNFTLTDAELNDISSSELVGLLHGLAAISHQIIYYGPSSMTALNSTMKGIHKLPAMFQPATAPTVFQFTTQEKNEVLFADYDMVQSEITWVRNVPGYEPTRQPVIDMFNNYFGGNMGALVFQTIRESKALAYSTYAFAGTPERREDPYLVSAYVGCQADKFAESVKAMNELLNELPSVANNLEAARAALKGDLETERITQDEIIANYLAAERRGLTEDIRKSTYAAVDKVAYNDLKKFHSEYMANQPFTYCVLASEDKINMEEVKKCGTLHKLTMTEIFGY